MKDQAAGTEEGQKLPRAVDGRDVCLQGQPKEVSRSMRFFRVVISGLGYRAYTGLKTHRTAADTKLITSRRGGKKCNLYSMV